MIGVRIITFWAAMVVGCLVTPGMCQGGNSQILMELKTCAWSSRECGLAWKIFRYETGCYGYIVGDYRQQIQESGNLIITPGHITQDNPSYLDTVFSLLLSHQLSRYGESMLCDIYDSSRVIRLIIIDDVGFESLTFTCSRGICSGVHITDSDNPFLASMEIHPINKRFQASESKLNKRLHRLTKNCDSIRNTGNIHGQFLLFENYEGKRYTTSRFRFNRHTESVFRSFFESY